MDLSMHIKEMANMILNKRPNDSLCYEDWNDFMGKISRLKKGINLKREIYG